MSPWCAASRSEFLPEVHGLCDGSEVMITPQDELREKIANIIAEHSGLEKWTDGTALLRTIYKNSAIEIENLINSEAEKHANEKVRQVLDRIEKTALKAAREGNGWEDVVSAYDKSIEAERKKYHEK